MSEHTGLPWKVSPVGYIYSDNDILVAQTIPSNVPGVFQAEANAEYIVLACNAFADIEEGISLIVEKKHYSQLEAQAKTQPDLLAACEISETCFRKLAGVSMLSSSKDVLLDNADLIKAAIEKATP